MWAKGDVMASSFGPIRNRRTRILLACGSPELTQTARDALKAAGFRRVLSVSTGDEAIKELSQGGVEVLATMVDLPDINAWRPTQLIRSGEFSPRSVPVIAVHEGLRPKFLRRWLMTRASPSQALMTLVSLPAR